VKPGGFLPLDTGGKIRSYHTVTNLARHWPTTVITFYPRENEDQNPKLAASVDKLIAIPFTLGPRKVGELSTYLSAVVHSRPYSFQKFCRPEVIRAVEAELRQTSYDVIICDFLLGCGVVPSEVQAAKVVFTHNVECRIWERHYKVAPNLPRRIVAKREWQTLAALEHKYLKEADLVLAVSDADAAEFVSWGLPQEKVRSVPTGVDTEFFSPQPRLTASKTLVFTGSMDWKPNQDGILWFLREVYPAIQAKVPAVKLVVVGRRPSPEIVQACAQHNSVTLTGWVDDIRDYLAAADVCVVPLRVGSGTRLKIFEAMAMGKATVSTTIGAEGLPVTDGVDILIGDTPSAFAAQTVALLQDAAKGERLGRAARTLVESRYSWDAVTGEFMRTIETAVKSHPGQ
jgi:sugar transferase (PEP-CTERM/EpsH1 system associated)